MSKVLVSDRAVLRWLQRVEGVDVAAIRRRIGAAAQLGADKGASGVKHQGVTIELRSDEAGNTVAVTVHTAHPRRHLSQPRLAADELGD
jgi:hypothetical protein